jgi:hypothetical protein
LTAFEKKETSAPFEKTMDTDENPTDLRGDTALSQSADASDGKGNILPSDKQAEDDKSSTQGADNKVPLFGTVEDDPETPT